MRHRNIDKREAYVISKQFKGRGRSIANCLLPISNCLLLVAFAIAIGSLLLIPSCKDKNVTAEVSAKEQWTCSMHPEIVRDKPGLCPICGMQLVKKVENGVAARNVQIDDLLKPTDQFVVSSIPVTTISNKSVPIEVEALGTIAYDTRLVNTISARVSGRIERLYVKYRYQHVMKGERIMDIYSPDLLTTQQELLFLLKNDPGNSALISAAKQKLLLLGVSESQLHEITTSGRASLTIAVYSNYGGHIHEAGNTMPGQSTGEQKMDISRITEELMVKEGMYVEKGQNIFQVYDVSRSWALLNIFPEYQALVKKGDAVRIVPETAPDKNFRAQIDFIEPFFRKENKTLAARVYFDNSKMQIPVGSQVKATIFAEDKEAEWLPKDAVLSLGIDKVVLLKEDGGFKALKIETGLTYKNRVQVLSGLSPTDSVAANAQYLVDSESFIKVK
jgi:membrane fusion protein, copper/silver efflux system